MLERYAITFSLWARHWKARWMKCGRVWLRCGCCVRKTDCRTCNDRFCEEKVIQRLMISQGSLLSSPRSRYSCLPSVESSLSSCFQSWFRAAINPEEAPIKEGWWNYAHQYKGFRIRALWRHHEYSFLGLVRLLPSSVDPTSCFTQTGSWQLIWWWSSLNPLAPFSSYNARNFISRN